MKEKRKSQSANLRRYRSPALLDQQDASLAVRMQEVVHDRLWDALLDGDLRPGTKVPEQQIGDAFKVSRTVIRSVLVVMEQEGVITLPPNRGAYIAWISSEKSSAMFETARLMTSFIAENLARNHQDISAEDRERIKQHIAFMADKTVPRNSRSMMRLGVEFLILLANVAGNQYLASVLEKTLSLIMMAALIYQEQFVDWPSQSVQLDIVKHIDAGNRKAASTAIKDYLAELEASFRYRFEAPDKDLVSVIADLSKDIELAN